MTAPAPRRRLSDRLLDEGTVLAREYAEQDRLDPYRPTLSVLVAEALALAERRGEVRLLQAREETLAVLADLVRAVDETVVEVVEWLPGAEERLRGSMDRARRHLTPTEESS